MVVAMDTLITAANLLSRATAAGLTLVVVAQRAGTAPSTLRRWRLGQHHPSVDNVRKWLDVVIEAEAGILGRVAL